MPKQQELIRQNQSYLHLLNDALDSGAFGQIRHLLAVLSPVDVAHLIESSPPKERRVLWGLIATEKEGELLPHLSDDVRAEYLRRLNTQQLVAATESLDTDDLADVLQQLPGNITQQVMSMMQANDRQRVEHILSYPDDTAGGLMDTDMITVRPSHTLDLVLRYLRRHDSIPLTTDSLIVVNRKDSYIGLLPIAKLLTTDPTITVREIMITDIDAIPAITADSEVALLFERNDLISAAVVDNDGRLLGRITIDDVVDVIRDEAEHTIMSLAGLDEDEDTFAPALRSAKHRALWLGVNLITAVIAAGVISLFQATIQEIVALAVLMPIVASMGGVAGSQTLTIVIRGIALGQVGAANAKWLLNRELAVALMNGVLWSVIIAGLTILWFKQLQLGIIIGAAIIVNLLVAALAGAMLPLALKRHNIDPALAGSVALTTITDVVGFFAFLGLASWFYI